MRALDREKQLEDWANSTNWQIRRAAASSAYASEAILSKLSEDEVDEVRVAVARNTATIPAILLELAETVKGGEKHISPLAKALVENPRSTESVLTALARVGDIEIANAILLRSDIPMGTLAALEAWPPSNIRRAAMCRRFSIQAEEYGLPKNTGPDALMLLFGDLDYYNEGYDPMGYAKASKH